MPDLFRCKLLRAGDYCAPQGVYTANADSMRRQVKAFRKLKSEGYKFPVPWGHRLSAIPSRDEVDPGVYQQALEQRAFEEARWNAGYVEDLDIDQDGDLTLTLPAPPGYKVDAQTGDLVNEADGTRIREVSGAFGNWTDGKGRTHRDILIHAALCVRPVMGGQNGFELATAKQPVTLATGIVVNYRSLSTRIEGTSMADKKKKSDDDMDIDDMDLSETDNDSPAEPDEPNPPAPKEEPEPEPEPKVKVNQSDMLDKLLALLNQAGLTMPDHTSEDNLIEHLITALTVAVSMGAKFEKSDNPDANQPAQASTEQPPQPEAPMPMMMATTIAGMTDAELSKYGVQRIGVTMLSTNAMTDREKTWANSQRDAVRKKIAAIYKQCRDKYGLFPDIAQREMAKASSVQLSFLPNGDYLHPAALDAALVVREILRRQLGMDANPVSQMTTTLSTTYVPDNPMAAKKTSDDLGTRSLRRVSGDPKAELAKVRG